MLELLSHQRVRVLDAETRVVFLGLVELDGKRFDVVALAQQLNLHVDTVRKSIDALIVFKLVSLSGDIIRVWLPPRLARARNQRAYRQRLSTKDSVNSDSKTSQCREATITSVIADYHSGQNNGLEKGSLSPSPLFPPFSPSQTLPLIPPIVPPSPKLSKTKNKQKVTSSDNSEQEKDLFGNLMEKSVPPADSLIRKIFDHWRVKCNRPNSKLYPATVKLLTKAFTEFGYESCLSAIDYIASSDWHRGKNPEHKEYTDLSTIFAKPERTQDYINKAKTLPVRLSNKYSTDEIDFE